MYSQPLAATKTWILGHNEFESWKKGLQKFRETAEFDIVELDSNWNQTQWGQWLRWDICTCEYLR